MQPVDGEANLVLARILRRLGAADDAEAAYTVRYTEGGGSPSRRCADPAVFVMLGVAFAFGRAETARDAGFQYASHHPFV